ncbi:MAG: hypothetical protein ACJ75R_04025, partial [Solirubrobacterales bacterium]
MLVWGRKRSRIRRAGPPAMLAIALVALVPSAWASPGDLDPSFGGQGKISRGYSAVSVAVQPDGKTLVLGTNRLTRLTVKGERDKSFGKKSEAGSVKTGIPVGYSGRGAADLAVAPDGKILIVGFVDNKDDSASLAVSRLGADGALDTSFGSGGVATVALEGMEDLSTGSNPDPRIALRSDGAIVLAASFAGHPQVARLTAGGAPDPSLGGDGSVLADLGPSGRVFDLALTADGKIVLAGSSKPAASAAADFAVSRLGPTGAPDPTFSSDGVQSTDFGGADSAAGVAVEPDGAVVAGGTSDRCDRKACPRFAVARYTSAGELDPTFAASGMATAAGPAKIPALAAGMVLQADGKIVIAGGENDFLLARFNADGSLDQSFGDKGLVWTPFLGSYPAYGSAIALGADGKIVVAGLVYLEEYYDELTIARYEVADGPPDLDADSVKDREDACPRTWGSDASGCPVIKRTVKLKYDRNKHRIFGKIRVKQISGEPLSGYLPGTVLYCGGDDAGVVTLYEQRRGRDRPVDTDRTPGSLEFKSPGKGTFYALVKKTTVTA